MFIVRVENLTESRVIFPSAK